MEEFAGAHEVALLLGVSRQRVFQLAARDDFPRPVAVLKATRVWRTEDILTWQRERDERQRRG